MPKALDLTGQKFGLLTVLQMNPERTTSGKIKWDIICDCGNRRSMNGSHLTSGWVKSCGCTRAENVKKACATHGLSGTREHKIWVGMKQRCFNEKNPDYRHYGGRGITVCEQWRDSFENFYADLGPAPSEEHTLERREVNGNYEPNNCFWATREEQANNTRRNTFVEYKGKLYTVAELARLPEVVEKEISYITLYSRIFNSGFSVDEAVSEAVSDPGFQTKHFFDYEGKTLSLSEWATLKDIPYQSLRDRIFRYGWTFEKAISTKVGEGVRGRDPELYAIDDVTKTRKEWCEHFGLNINTVRARVGKGMLFEVALRLPRIGKTSSYTIDDETKTLETWCRENNATFSLFVNRLFSGWTVQEALQPIQNREITYDNETHSLEWWCDLFGFDDKNKIYLKILRGEDFAKIVDTFLRTP